MSANPDGTPVVVHKELYDYLANKARERGMTLKGLVNDWLLTVSKRYLYLERKFPKIKVDAVGTGGFVMLRDTSGKQPETVIVKVGHHGIECLSHQKQVCDHVKFVCMTPDIDSVLVPEDITQMGECQSSPDDEHKDDEELNNHKRLTVTARLESVTAVTRTITCIHF